MSNSTGPNRRQFIKTSAAVGGAFALGAGFNTAYAQGSDTIRVALVGCGGRGTGAVNQMFNTKGNVKLVAVADAFENNARGAVNSLRRADESKVDVPDERIFTGLDAYKKAIDVDCDLVAIATPPGFKPQQFEYAVKKGRHIFCEKPVAVDAPGVRRFLTAVEESKRKNLMVAIGLQRRHEEHYKNIISEIRNGVIGDVIATRVYWNGGGIWFRDRQPGWTDMQDQCNNWYHFIWACGDQICEQHIHNLDVGCWIKDAYPIECNGMGGSERRLNGDHTQSQIYDHTFCEYTFSDGSKMFSQGRHLQNAFNRVAEYAHGTKGEAAMPGLITVNGQRRRIEGGGNGHQQEQHDLIEALMRGEIYNEGEYGAKSTFTAILGREACYSGQIVTWDKLLADGKDYTPNIDNWTWNTTPPAQKNAEGKYDVPMPGLWNPYKA